MNTLTKFFFKDAFNLPNSISFFRLTLAIPIYFVIRELHTDETYRYILTFLVLLASFSDVLDGHIARKKNMISEFGKIIDPVADKVVIIMVVTQLYLLDEILGLYFWIILGRDILIFAGGIFVSKKIKKILPSNLVGKITVLSIGVFLMMTILALPKNNFFYHLFFYLSIVMSIVSVMAYSLRAYEALKWNKSENI